MANKSGNERRSGSPASDEHPHDPPSIPNWRERWGFQFYDPKAKLCGLFNISSHPNIPKQEFHLVLLADSEVDLYINTLPLQGRIDKLSDGNLTFSMVEPNHQWNISFDEGSRFAELEFHGRIPPVKYDSKLYRMEGVLELEYYGQPCIVKGNIRLDDGASHDIHCLGYRDHSWGIRDDAAIDKWYRVVAHFEWCVINLIQLQIRDRTLSTGFMVTNKGTQQLKDVEVVTRYEPDAVTPEGFDFRFKDETGENWLLKSAKIQTMMRSPRPIKPGYHVSIYDVVSHFMLKRYPSSGYGIAEYLTNQISSLPGELP